MDVVSTSQTPTTPTPIPISILTTPTPIFIPSTLTSTNNSPPALIPLSPTPLPNPQPHTQPARLNPAIPFNLNFNSAQVGQKRRRKASETHVSETDANKLLQNALELVQKAYKINPTNQIKTISQSLENALGGRKGNNATLEEKIDQVLEKLQKPNNSKPTYAQATSKGLLLPAPRGTLPPKPAPPISTAFTTPKEATQLTLILNKEAQTPTLNPKQIRDEINTTLKGKGYKAPVVAKVAFSLKGNITLTTLSPYGAKDLEKNIEIVRKALQAFPILYHTTPQAWAKLIAHGVPISSTMLESFKEEAEIYSGVSIVGQPRWLVQPLEGKTAGSVVFSVASEAERRKALKGLNIEGTTVKVVNFKAFSPKTQCVKCQGFGHDPYKCKSQPACRLCASSHLTKDHVCKTCKTNGSCMHLIPKCINCQGAHTANSQECQTLKVIRQ